VITAVARHAAHIEYECEREDAFGALVRYTIVIASGNEPPSDVSFASREAAVAGRTMVVVAGEGGPSWLSWNEFLAVLGGAVPSWRALADSYPDALRIASRNELPPDTSGEAWRMFEEAVADGLEFAFADKYQRSADDVSVAVQLIDGTALNEATFAAVARQAALASAVAVARQVRRVTTGRPDRA
jgi:hypothetical protein